MRRTIKIEMGTTIAIIILGSKFEEPLYESLLGGHLESSIQKLF